MDVKSLILITPILLLIIVIHVAWAKVRINQWATRNKFKMIKCKLCLVDIGPFSYFGTSGGQSIFKIEVMNEQGEIRKGYARAGGFFFGLLRKRVEVKWNKLH